MTVMYVDDSGSPSYRDHTDYFILSGVIVDDNKIRDLQKSVLAYKHSNFRVELMDAEIHAYDINRSRGDFEFQDRLTQINLLNKLYEMIDSLDCAGIIVTINKNKLLKDHPTWDVSNTAWSFLLEIYESLLQENPMGLGRIKSDKSSNKIHETIQMMVGKGMDSQKFSSMAQPTFVDSSGVFGIQVADAFAYCTLKHKSNDDEFSRYWDVICGKLARDKTGMDVGYKEYPR